MARITVEDCLSKVTNRFELVILVAKRAKQLAKGSKITVPSAAKNKQVVSSLREVAMGTVKFDNLGDQEEINKQIERDLSRDFAVETPSS